MLAQFEINGQRAFLMVDFPVGAFPIVQPIRNVAVLLKFVSHNARRERVNRACRHKNHIACPNRNAVQVAQQIVVGKRNPQLFPRNIRRVQAVVDMRVGYGVQNVPELSFAERIVFQLLRQRVVRVYLNRQVFPRIQKLRQQWKLRVGRRREFQRYPLSRPYSPPAQTTVRAFAPAIRR